VVVEVVTVDQVAPEWLEPPAAQVVAVVAGSALNLVHQVATEPQAKALKAAMARLATTFSLTQALKEPAVVAVENQRRDRMEEPLELAELPVAMAVTASPTVIQVQASPMPAVAVDKLDKTAVAITT
jgi:hypothetical protein